MPLQSILPIPGNAILARVVLFARSGTDTLQPIKVHLWPADSTAASDAVCYLHIEELLPRPVPVTGIDNMHAMEQALLLADTTLRNVDLPARLLFSTGKGAYLSTRRP